MRIAAVVAVVALLALAGCSGLVDEFDPPETERPTASPTPTSTSTSTATPATTATAETASERGTPKTTETATETPDVATDEPPGPTPTERRDLSRDNPWNAKVVPVAINDTAHDGRNTTAITERALAYWNAKMDRYTDYAFRLESVDEASEARIEIRFVNEIGECNGPANHTVGCARLIEPDEEPRDLEVAWVTSNHSNSAVTGTAKHELGHLLGLDHDDDPQFLLAQRSEIPVKNASERANPWYADTLTVAVDRDSFEGDRETVDAQVTHALEFYAAGANGTVPANVSFESTDQRHAADVLVTNDPKRCSVEDGSTVRIQGQDADPDPALEAHTRATICVDVDADAVGWHVGNWLGAAYGLDREERASVFQDAGYQERRSKWWT